MPPKKRKIESDAKGSEVSEPVETAADIEVKTERLSQEEGKDSSQKVEEKPEVVRNLRPRKTTCYTERDSPEINYEEKQRKVLRRKRRPVPTESGCEEKETKIKRTEKLNDKNASLLEVELPPPTLVSCTVLSTEKTLSDKSIECSGGTKIGPIEGCESGEKQTEHVQKKRKKLKQKSDTILLDPKVIPKTEPVSPSAIPENNSLVESNSGSKPVVDSVAAKPKPKKRVRSKKLLKLSSPTDDDGKFTEQPVVKQEVEDNEVCLGKEAAKDCETEKKLSGADKQDSMKENSTRAPIKKQVKKKPKPQVKREPSENTVTKTEDSDTSKNTGVGESTNGEKELKVEGVAAEIKHEANGNENTRPTVVKKRIKSRPKKPAGNIKITTDNGKNLNEKSKDEMDNKKSVENDGNGTEETARQPGTTARKPFFRGRRSKSISARTGRKEIIHKDEAIDPEDIRGFEHVEKYVTPPGVRLPKFWDSEDEMSEDENNDNFRRIMCGFGTNCRIHEVIRPASEIVRRLKELQNTFGATKSLPLFQKNETETNEDILTSSEPFFRRDRDRTITWHTDPSFFKYANNYPSKCK